MNLRFKFFSFASLCCLATAADALQDRSATGVPTACTSITTSNSSSSSSSDVFLGTHPSKEESSSSSPPSSSSSSPPSRRLGMKKKKSMIRGSNPYYPRPVGSSSYPPYGRAPAGPAYSGSYPYGGSPSYPAERIADDYWRRPAGTSSYSSYSSYTGGGYPSASSSYYPPRPVPQPWGPTQPNAVLIAKKKKYGYKVKGVVPYADVSPINMMYNWPYTPYNGAYQSPVYDSYLSGRGIYRRPSGCGTGHGYSMSCLRRLRRQVDDEEEEHDDEEEEE